MNVLGIWAGEWYAYYPYKGNKRFIMNARKGKCIKVEKIKGYGSERAMAMVTFESETGLAEVIRARDVIDVWDSYENEREGIRREREEAAAMAEQRREEMLREREERFRLHREQAEARERQESERTENLVTALVAKTGMPKEIISSVGSTTVALDRTSLEFWLSIKNGGGNGS